MLVCSITACGKTPVASAWPLCTGPPKPQRGMMQALEEDVLAVQVMRPPHASQPVTSAQRLKSGNGVQGRPSPSGA